MTQITQKEINENTELGNTRRRSWCFTLNNYTQLEINDLLTQFALAKMYIFQEEIGEKGTPHLQGVVEWNHGKSFMSMKKINKKMNLSRTKKLKASVIYCGKERTRSGKTWQKGTEKYKNKSEAEIKIAFEKYRKKRIELLIDKLTETLSYQDIIENVF